MAQAHSGEGANFSSGVIAKTLLNCTQLTYINFL